MAVSRKASWIWENATAAIVGYAAQPGAAATGATLATANTHIPLGVTTEEAAQNATVSIETVCGSVVKGVAGGSIAFKAKVTASTGGKFATATKLAGTGIVVGASEEYEWGASLEATTTADLDYFTLLYQPHEVEQ